MKKFAVFLFLFTLGCSFVPTADVVQSQNGSWCYQLQDAVPGSYSYAGFDTLVTDYSYDGTESGAYSSNDVEEWKAMDIKTLCYLSIGEAEDYRWYWQAGWSTSPPAWLGPENRDWGGNYKVRYWDSGWQTIIFAYLDKILSANFDGVYLDIIDAYYYWSEENPVLSESNAASLMIDFVCDIKNYAVSNGYSNFLVYPQNGEDILRYDDGRYISNIDGVGIEDLFYNGTRTQDSDERIYRLPFVQQLKDAGKEVLLVEYCDDGNGYNHVNSVRISRVIEHANEEGFVPYIASEDRELSFVNLISPVQP